MNGKILEDLKKLASEKNISTDAALRLMCTVQAGFAEAIIDMGESDKEAAEERSNLSKNMETLARNSEQQTSDLRKLNDKLEKRVFGNPFVVAGNFIREHPKASTTIFVTFVLVSNLWFISGFRRAIMLLLRIPPEIIDAIAP